MKEEIKSNYIDVTNEWLMAAIPNNYLVKDLNYWTINNIKHYVDGKKIVLDYTPNERKCAEWLKNTFGGKIFMCPRVNNPENNGTKKQSNNYIIDVTNNKLSNKEILSQIEFIYKSKGRIWVDKIIVKRNNDLIKIYVRKKD